MKSTLTKQQKLFICQFLDIDFSTLNRWEAGKARIPKAAILACKDLPDMPEFLKSQESKKLFL